jgi:3-methyladenine DNA glycosylase AlkD
MTIPEIREKLQRLGTQKLIDQNKRHGVGDNQYGVKLGDLRSIAKQLKPNNEFALQLWKTNNFECRLIGILLMKPKELTTQQIYDLVNETDSPQLADWLNSYVVKSHPEKESLRQQWMNSTHPMQARTAWSLCTELVSKNPEQQDPEALLIQIQAELTNAPEAAKWTMNFCLIAIGTHYPEHRQRAIEIGEQAGAYIDYPVSKGCTSPYAPIAIRELASRLESTD